MLPGTWLVNHEPDLNFCLALKDRTASTLVPLSLADVCMAQAADIDLGKKLESIFAATSIFILSRDNETKFDYSILELSFKAWMTFSSVPVETNVT